MKILLYCTKRKKKVRVGEHLYTYSDELYKLPNGEIKFGDSIELATYESNEYSQDNFLNGHILAECDCDNIEIFTTDYRGNPEQNERIVKDSCVSISDLIDYQGENQFLYALHLSNVKVFDEPKELYDYDVKPKSFKTFDDWSITNITYSCSKAPQNMCNVYDRFGNRYVLISVQPQHLVKILNGEKTSEVRKKILNYMKELIVNG